MVARTQQRWQTPTWKQELATAFTDPIELLETLGLGSSDLADSARQSQGFPFLVPKGFAALMSHGDPNDPLLRQVLPVAAEGRPAAGFVVDPVGDAMARRAPGLLQKYQGRALLITTGACALHCRYCFRRHFPYADDGAQRDRFAAALNALEQATDVDEIILSGGDPLMLDDAALTALVTALDKLPQLKRLRLHTRLPSVLPSRITETLCAMLSRSRLQLVVVVHVNHPRELGPEAAQALQRLAELGAPLLNQSVLLRGVNDALETLVELSESLIAARVLPYYLHLLDPVAGAAHFDVPETQACSLVTRLRQRLPGYLVPRLVREQPGEGAKTVLL